MNGLRTCSAATGTIASAAKQRQHESCRAVGIA